MTTPIKNRYEFVLLFDVKDGNPNGDPDAGNIPRIDPDTEHGLVTDVCLKRKIRNYVALAKRYADKFDIYVKEKAVLGHAHTQAFKDLGIKLGEETAIQITKETYEWLEQNGLPMDTAINDNDENNYSFVINANADKKELKSWLKEMDPPKAVKEAINDALKNAKPRKPVAAEIEQGREKMCEKFFDIRTFGGVLSLKSAPNCGQVSGPVQITFARSISPIISMGHSITRMAVATDAEAEKQNGENRTMGRKFTVPYALYRCHGYISAPSAEKTGFSEEDLTLFWEALINMFEHDHSAARGQMNARKLVVFQHDSKMGSAPSHKLLEMVKVRPKIEGEIIRDYNQYEIIVPGQGDMPEGVTVIDKI